LINPVVSMLYGLFDITITRLEPESAMADGHAETPEPSGRPA